MSRYKRAEAEPSGWKLIVAVRSPVPTALTRYQSSSLCGNVRLFSVERPTVPRSVNRGARLTWPDKSTMATKIESLSDALAVSSVIWLSPLLTSGLSVYSSSSVVLVLSNGSAGLAGLSRRRRRR